MKKPGPVAGEGVDGYTVMRHARPARASARNLDHLRSRHAVLRLLDPSAGDAAALDDRIAGREPYDNLLI
jgi:hypothetical protein